MKILQLRFKNLNSLAGEWSIDFTSPEYVSDGIFAISGPTGAGKSTILDAICLALYGCTPRLENISSSTNEIMSRQTGECFAEVVFENHEGRFKAHWSQRRARGRADGALQQPKHEISDALTDKILASQIKATGELVEKKTGMDFGRFTQSMLLAQGGFAAFLQATGSERAPILEQITGTEIYSRISVHIYDRQKDEKIKYDQLFAECQGIVLLGPDEEAQIIKDLDEKNRSKISLAATKEQLEASVNWLRTIDKLKSEQVQNAAEEAELMIEIDSFKPSRKVLRDATHAANLEGEYASLTAIRGQQNEDIGMLNLLNSQTPELYKEQDAAKISFENAVKNYKEIQKEHESLLDELKKVRALDQEIVQTNADSKKTGEEILRLKAEIVKETSKKSAVDLSISRLNTEIETVNTFMEVNKADSALVAELTGIRAKEGSLSEAKRILDDVQEKLNTLNRSLEGNKLEVQAASDEIDLCKKQHLADLDQIKSAEQEKNRLLNGSTLEILHTKKDQLFLHIADIRRVADFDTERSRLEDLKPCPLCGSLHHPYADGNIPGTTKEELELSELIQQIKNIETLNENLADLKTTERQSDERVSQAKARHNLLLQQHFNFEVIIKSQNLELDKCNISYKEQADSLKQLLLPLGISAIPGTQMEINAMIKSLSDRKDKWLEAEQRKIQISGEILAKEGESKISVELIKTRNKDVEKRNADLELLNKKLIEKKGQRLESFDAKNADEEETKSLQNLKLTEDSKMRKQEDFQIIKQKLEENLNRVSDLKTMTGKRQSELNSSEKKFLDNIVEQGFATEETFNASRLPASDRQKLEGLSKRLDERKTAIETSKADREKRLREESSRNLTNETQEQLVMQLSEVAASLETVTMETGALDERLKVNNEKKEKGSLIADKIELQKKVLDRWLMLNGLIGSADGKKYRNFAQGLTLEIMVSHANSQLAKLSDRYLLVRDRDEPLELNVMDNYQAGEIRSTKNLSGGESFIVSLALALGLSRMSSRKVRVDSLFLDEGFGSLDEDTLETALGTLASLRQDGKIIGIISHVGAMKDRISTKILVQPLREGRSILQGPGCSRKELAN